jgi:hypothetical protein
MVRMAITILFFLSGVLEAGAGISCFARISLDRHSVYVQQPFRVTVTVLTETWYTAPLEFDNIRLPNAFVLPFDKTTPGMFDIGGRQMAGLQFYFIVFPYTSGSFVFPSISITAHSPAPGESKARVVLIRTEPQSFTVKPVPAGRDKADWLVAKNVFISESWSRSLGDLKVGDILERTITVRAMGTLPQFIPPLPEESLQFAGIYRHPARLKDERNEYEANGRLSQTIIYLLEKQGDFSIPAIRISWWDPNNSRFYNRSAASADITVKANPDLGMLTTIRDSLANTDTKRAIKPGSGGKWTIFGLAWYTVILLLGMVLLLWWLGVKLARGLFNKRKTSSDKTLRDDRGISPWQLTYPPV